MCQPASFVLTKNKCFWSEISDSHEVIIDENKLHADGMRESNIVRVEIFPPNGNFCLPLDQWIFHTDQLEDLPAWYDPIDAEERTRIELPKWLDANVILPGVVREVIDGHIVACYGSLTLRGTGSANIYGSGSVTLYDNSFARLSNSSLALLYNHSSAKLYDRSSATLYEDSSVVAFDNSLVSANDNSSVVAYHESLVNARGRSCIVAFDRTLINAYSHSSVNASDKSLVIYRNLYDYITSIKEGNIKYVPNY